MTGILIKLTKGVCILADGMILVNTIPCEQKFPRNKECLVFYIEIKLRMLQRLTADTLTHIKMTDV